MCVPKGWFERTHTNLRKACGIPEDMSFQTKPEIGLKLLQVAVERGSLPFQWVAADELYGDSPAFRDGVARLNKWYFTEIKCTTQDLAGATRSLCARLERAWPPPNPPALAQSN